EPEHKETALRAEAKAAKRGVQFLLPEDTVVATPVETGKLNKKGKPVMDFVNVRIVKGDIPDDGGGFDIGPETAKRYGEIIRHAKTILWNGPMGMFEDERFAG